ncbi:MAG: nuclear transport factor 2 family protein [Ramlibacter sp.]|nr:nuclear transport factor 2 family protein [Ramlibacter sp.]
MGRQVYVDAVRGRHGSYEEWVAEFARKWQRGRASAEDFMDLMGPEIRLIAPGLRPTIGRDAGTEAFRRAFMVMPDLTATVSRWAERGDRLFIEMTFEATVGGRRIAWPNVDRFVFEGGYAVERAAYFNPMKVRSAFLRSPSGWMQLVKRRWVGL